MDPDSVGDYVVEADADGGAGDKVAQVDPVAGGEAKAAQVIYLAHL